MLEQELSLLLLLGKHSHQDLGAELSQQILSLQDLMHVLIVLELLKDQVSGQFIDK